MGDGATVLLRGTDKEKRDSSTAQADPFTGVKGSACFARNDSGWGWWAGQAALWNLSLAV